MTAPDNRKNLPPVDALLEDARISPLLAGWRRPVVVRALQKALAATREAMKEGNTAGQDRAALTETVVALAIRRLDELADLGIHRVINATGVLIHTNLGRSPLSRVMLKRMAECLDGYVDLEFDGESGKRGHRDSFVSALLAELVGAEDATAVNNNAAAVYLALHALADGGEVLVSRGELVEIGGGFRIPDVLAASGAVLREVGTTNRTRADDYARAFSPLTRCLLRVHRSNFTQSGFVETPDPRELAGLARKMGVPFLVDAGSGRLIDDGPNGTPPGAPPPLFRTAGEEPDVASLLQWGADLVCFSGDKFLGGPQAGLAAGKAELVARLRRDPLMRALRLDKMTLFALVETLKEHLRPGRTAGLPLLAMAAEPPESVRRRCRLFLRRLEDGLTRDALPLPRLEVVPVESVFGGGATPSASIPSFALQIEPVDGGAASLQAFLRRQRPPVVIRVEKEAALLDFRTVGADDEKVLLAHLLRRAGQGGAVAGSGPDSEKTF